MIPTPTSLAESIRDLAKGYDTELVGTLRPDPIVGHYLSAMARRVADRIPGGDPRRHAFAPFTDETGYVWLDTNQLGEFFSAAAAGKWSFERWFNGLVAVLRTVEPPTAEELAEKAAFATRMATMARSGFRPVSVDSSGLVLKRDE